MPLSNLPTTEGRVPRHGSYERHNKKVTDQTIKNLQGYVYASKNEVDNRLAYLAKEWDMERTLEFNASIAASVGLVLSVLSNPNWRIFSFVVLGFLFQHAVMGYCPPAVWFRAAGWRTAGEIEDEQLALRMLHGRALGVLKQAATDKEFKQHMLNEMINNKRVTGRFLGQGPEQQAALAKEE